MLDPVRRLLLDGNWRLIVILIPGALLLLVDQTGDGEGFLLRFVCFCKVERAGSRGTGGGRG